VIELTHGPEPSELADFRNKAPQSNWGDPAFNPVRTIVKHQLNDEQGGCCIYCEQELARDDGHVEHIKSKSRNQTLTFDYGNLAHSCNDGDHCGHHKKSQIIPIEPRGNCNYLFSLTLSDGLLVPAIGANAQERTEVENTVKTLGLNKPSLAWKRKGFAESLLALSPEERRDFLATCPFRWTLNANFGRSEKL